MGLLLFVGYYGLLFVFSLYFQQTLGYGALVAVGGVSALAKAECE